MKAKRRSHQLPAVIVVAVMVLLTAYAATFAQGGRAMLRRAEAEIRNQRFAEAESTLTIVTRSARGEIRREALFLLAGLRDQADGAQEIYRTIIESDPASEWAVQARIELAKIQYALGRYHDALRLLRESRACGEEDEACLFEGLSALMVGDYEQARESLSSIRRGKYRTWAYLLLAESDAGMQRTDEACRRYESLANAMISPTALYRYAECLEDEGDVEGASARFGDIIDNFRDTPEAVLAAEKLQLLSQPPEPEVTDDTHEPAPGKRPLAAGFTIQFGSFRDRGNAIKMAAKMKRRYPGMRVDSELVRYREHHRVRYGYFRTREEARAKGDEIAREMGEDFTIMTIP